MKNWWEKLQGNEEVAYKEAYRRTGSYFGFFSVPEMEPAVKIAEMLKGKITGNVLDIGCGVLPKPVYMFESPDVAWFGIDPFEGEHKREFEFKQATAEKIPYPDNMFDAVLFMSSLDHCQSPELALREAGRVLKLGGKLFVWEILYNDDSRYRQWEGSNENWDGHHHWAFCDRTLTELLESSGVKLAHRFKVIHRYILRGNNKTYPDTWLYESLLT